MRLLVTGFEPFAGETVNPSAELLRAIQTHVPLNVDLKTMELPVRAGVGTDLLVTLFEEGKYDAWLGLGQAGGRSELSVERVGINLLIDGSSADKALEEQALVDDGPAAYLSNFPVRELAQEMSLAGAATTVSNSAGTYICNEVLYVMQHHLAMSGDEMPTVFLHLPYLPEQLTGKTAGTSSMALETQIIGVKSAIRFIEERVTESVILESRR